MRECRTHVQEENDTITIKSYKSSKSSRAGIAQASDSDVLTYMADLLLEMETMAVGARFEGLADLLAYAQRETVRKLEAI